MTNKSNKKLNTGKIYKRSESNNSRVIDEVQKFGYETEKNNLITISSAPRVWAYLPHIFRILGAARAVRLRL
jgi:hypothetical protein